MENESAIHRENDRILSRFSPEFKEKISIIPEYHVVYSMLLGGADEYKIIEELLGLLHNRNNEIVRITQEKKPKYIWMKKENP